MTEEEKKVFIKIKGRHEYFTRDDIFKNDFEQECLFEIDYLIQIIEKLQKENEELNNRDTRRLSEIGELRSKNSYLENEIKYYYIAKDKIREKIKELEEYIVKEEEETCGKCITIGEDMTIRYLKELLEEE